MYIHVWDVHNTSNACVYEHYPTSPFLPSPLSLSLTALCLIECTSIYIIYMPMYTYVYMPMYIYIYHIVFTHIFTHIPCALYLLRSSPCLAPTSLLLLSPLPLSSLLLSLPRVSHLLVSLLWPFSRCSIMHPVELPSPCLSLSCPLSFLSLYHLSLGTSFPLSPLFLTLSLPLSFSLFYLSPIILVSIPSSLSLLSLFAI